MINGKELEIRVDDHVIVRMGGTTRRRYIVDSVTPQRQSAIIRAADIGYHPIYRRQPQQFEIDQQIGREYGFADRYRVRASYGTLRAIPFGANDEYDRPYTEVMRPIDDLDGTAAGAQRIINYGHTTYDPRASELGTRLNIYGGHDAQDNCVLEAYLAVIDGVITLVAHVTEGVQPVVRVVHAHP